MCKFRLGQKVVCINADMVDFSGRKDTTPPQFDQWLLVKGEIYTVAAIHFVMEAESYTILLEEIPLRPQVIFEMDGLPYMQSPDYGYHQDRFRPLKETNIDIFLGMLNPNDETVKKFQEEDEYV